MGNLQKLIDESIHQRGNRKEILSRMKNSLRRAPVYQHYQCDSKNPGNRLALKVETQMYNTTVDIAR